MSKESTNKHWVKFPGPGEMRGQGIWVAVEDENAGTGVSLADRLQMWNYYMQTGFLPTHVGPEPPDEDDKDNEEPDDSPIPRMQ